MTATPGQNDGRTPSTITVRDVPVGGFRSIGGCNAQGGYRKNPPKAYSLNNVTATCGADGRYTIHFGGDPKAPNCLAVFPRWSCTVRLDRPRPAALSGDWKFPTAVRVARTAAKD